MLGTQCSSQGAPLGICPQSADVMVAGSAAATVPPTEMAVDPAAPGAPTANPLKPPVSAAPAVASQDAAASQEAAAPENAAAAFSVHDLIEASHERLLLAQAKRPLFGDSPGTDGDEGDGGGPAAVASPAQLAYAAVPPTSSPEPPVTDRAAAPSIRAEFGTALPSTPLPDETESAPLETAGVGGPLLPPLPEPEPPSLPAAEPDAGETPEVAAPDTPDVAPVASVVRIGDSRVNVRTGPSTADARLFGLDPGEEVMASESSDGWMKIEDAAGRVGWVLSELLAGADDDIDAGTAAAATAATVATAEPATTEPASEAPAATTPAGADVRTVSGTGVSVREAPSNAGTRLFALAAGEDVTVTGSDKGWLQIVDSRGRTGWAYSDFFAPKP